MTTQSCRLTQRQLEANKLLTGPQRHTELAGGSRSGKTFVLTRATAVRAIRAAGSRHAILRHRYNALRASIWLDTFPKVMRQCFPSVPYTDHRQDGYVSFPNGSELWFVGLDDPARVEKVLGLEFATMYFNECSQLQYSSVLTALTRLAQQVDGLQNRAYYDLNPLGTSHWTHRLFIEHMDPVTRVPLINPDDYRMMYLNPTDNRENIDPAYIASLEAMPERQRRRFLDGRYVAEIDGALWTIELLEKQRKALDDLPVMRRIVVAIDPSGARGPEDKRSDEIGMVVASLGVDDKGYVLADTTTRDKPETWGALAVRNWKQYEADRVIGERNYGGDMVRAVVHAADPRAPFKEVVATRGKIVRAEPIAALYEQGKVFHVGRFPALEEELSNFSVSGYLGERSPNRADALIWALTELMLGAQDESSVEDLSL